MSRSRKNTGGFCGFAGEAKNISSGDSHLGSARLGSKNIHQADSFLSNPLQGERGKRCSLSGRLFGAGAQQIGAQTAHRFRVTNPEGGRLPDEPEEMPLGPAAGV